MTTPLNPTSTRALLRVLKHAPDRKLGQNFLIDGNIVQKSIKLADIGKGATVVEIGPGLGTLTRAILETGAELWAIERDAALSDYLRTKIVPEQPALHLAEGNCLEHPRARLHPEPADASFKIVANLPYAVSTPWMEAILAGPFPERMVLMLQKEAADRYVAGHGNKNFGAISIFLQSAYEIHSRHSVSATCFYPTPKVDSTLLRLDLKEAPARFPFNLRKSIRHLFTQRRKQLRSLCKKESMPELDTWFESLIQKGYKNSARPEEIPIQEWTRLIHLQSPSS